MERREHYDPEDIESLLQERGFDELLEEERAYVLRHLTGREEYEAMRALLYQVRDDVSKQPPLQADADVKTAVMAAFRAQQQPQWRIWLNTLGTMMWPKEMSAMWRPALAIASVALLIVAGVQVMKVTDKATAHEQVAELKQSVPAKADPNTSLEKPAAPMEKDLARSESLLKEDAQGAVSAQSVTREFAPGAADAAAAAPPPPVMELAEEVNAEGEKSATLDFFTVTTTQSDEAKKAEEAPTMLFDSSVATGTTHQVTEVELARNESVANATGKVRTVTAAKEKAYKAPAATASLGESPELLALLSTGW